MAPTLMATGRLRRVLTEPLLHFAVLGAAIFWVWHARQPAEDSALTVVVDRATQDLLAEQLEKKLGRAPTDQERQTAVDRWVDGELLYREGLALGLDRDDPMVRRRVLQKMEFVGTNLELPEEPDEATLREFMAKYPERYAGPPRFDFELITVLRTPEDQDDSRAQAVLEQLKAGADPQSIEGRRASGKSFTGAALNKTYGVEVGAAVAALPVGQWGLVPIPQGWTMVHLVATGPGDAPPFEKVKNRVQLDWKQSQRNVALQARLDELRGKYRVQQEP